MVIKMTFCKRSLKEISAFIATAAASPAVRCPFDPLQLWAPLFPVWVEPPPSPGGLGHGIQACRAPGRQGLPLTPCISR